MMQSTAIAMSGGVDSTMAAYLIKQQNRPVIGMHFITGYEEGCLPVGGGTAKDPEKTDQRKHLMERARKRLSPISERLGIPLKIFDLRNDFHNSVVDYFAETYKTGQTPNPCMVCNPTIKFGTLLQAARKLGAGHLATGHYATVVKDEHGVFHLLRGKDPRKEQSYFLARLSQEQLASSKFPLGGLTKPEVKQMARSIGVFPYVKQESQDICFIKNHTYGDFLRDRFGFSPTPGPIVDLKGNVIGAHKGLHLFTIGQRRGINCPAAEPYYVVRLDMDNNKLIVGHKKDLLTSACRVKAINWIAKPPKAAVSVKTRVRYRHRETPSTLIPLNVTEAVVEFTAPQEAVTPGQCAVFYQGDEVMGGGWIQPLKENAEI